MPRNRLVVLQHLQVRSVSQRGPELSVELCGPEGAETSATLRFPDEWAAFENYAEVEGWRLDQRYLTHVSGWGECVLLDEECLLRRAGEG